MFVPVPVLLFEAWLKHSQLLLLRGVYAFPDLWLFVILQNFCFMLSWIERAKVNGYNAFSAISASPHTHPTHTHTFKTRSVTKRYLYEGGRTESGFSFFCYGFFSVFTTNFWSTKDGLCIRFRGKLATAAAAAAVYLSALCFFLFVSAATSA